MLKLDREMVNHYILEKNFIPIVNYDAHCYWFGLQSGIILNAYLYLGSDDIFGKSTAVQPLQQPMSFWGSSKHVSSFLEGSFFSIPIQA